MSHVCKYAIKNLSFSYFHLSLCSSLVNRREGEMISFKIDIRSPFIFNSMEKNERTCSQSITQFVPISSSFRHLALVIFANQCFEHRLIILSDGKYRTDFQNKFRNLSGKFFPTNVHLLREKDV